MEDNVSEPAAPEQEPTDSEQEQTDPRVSAARKESIKYRERAKTAEGHANELEQQLAQAQEELLGLKRVKAIEDACAKHEGLTAQDFNDFCTETDPEGITAWADRIAERFAHGLSHTRPDTLGDKGAFADNSKGGYAGTARNPMQSAIMSAVNRA